MEERLERLEQRHFDLIGLALIAAAIYLGFVLYGDWEGGRVGSWVLAASEYVAGAASDWIPPVVAACGLALILRPFIPAPGALNAGALLFVCGVLAALAAETAGLGPSEPPRTEYFDPAYMRAHGGVFGEALYWCTTTLFQRLGANIIAVLLMVSGAVLATGGTIAGALRGTGRAAARAAKGTRELTTAVIARPGAMADAGKRTPGFPTSPTSRLPGDSFATEPLIPAPEPEPAVDDFAFEDPGADDDEAVQPELDDEAHEPVPLPPEPEGGEIGVARTPMGAKRGITESEERDYQEPPVTLLAKGKGDSGPDTRDLDSTGRALLEALGHFGVEARIIGVVSGPHVSRFELQLAPGTKVGVISKLKDDLAYALASTDIRILAPIPGKRAVGVEVPNKRRKIVRLGDIYGGRPKGASPLLAWLGKDVSGEAVYADLAKMPHLLVAGTTGSGKSGCINAILTSILMHASPNEVRMALVDPKQVELNHYESIPHLLTPVVTAPRVAANVLSNLIAEMETRYGVMGKARARNLVELNKARAKAGEPPLPHILCVIDELADLMMVAPAEVEDSIIRLAQKSRAVGIHLVLATQRPSTDVITGMIKTNIPARIAFSVASQVDSRVILDTGGAESLLGQGDMLFRPIGTSKMKRTQGAFVTEEEIARITRHWSRQGDPEFDVELLEARVEPTESEEREFSPDEDPLLTEAAQVVVESETASVSMIQRRLRVGYTRAGRLIDMLESRGIISGYEGSKPRQVLVSAYELPHVLGTAPADVEATPGSNGETEERETVAAPD